MTRGRIEAADAPVRGEHGVRRIYLGKTRRILSRICRNVWSAKKDVEMKPEVTYFRSNPLLHLTRWMFAKKPDLDPTAALADIPIPKNVAGDNRAFGLG